MIQQYLSEIEELRVKLLESEALCKQLRKQNQIRASTSPRTAMTGSFDLAICDSSTNGLIVAAKRDLQKDLDLLATKGRPPGPGERSSGPEADQSAPPAQPQDSDSEEGTVSHS